MAERIQSESLKPNLTPPRLIRMSRFFSLILVFFSWLLGTVAASFADDGESPPGLFVGPRTPPSLSENIKYPYVARKHGYREGWVEIKFMVSETGETYDIQITDSFGGESFENAARDAVEATTFVPATQSDQPVASIMRLRLLFKMEGGTSGASQGFARRMRRFSKALEAGDIARAGQVLDEVKKKGLVNYYEGAHFWFRKAQFHERRGDDILKWDAIENTLQMGPGYIGAEVYDDLAAMLMSHYLGTENLSGAVYLPKQLERVNADSALQRLAPVIERIRALHDEPGILLTDTALSPDGRWFSYLLKPMFSVEAEAGEVERIELNCNGKVVRLPYTTQNLRAPRGKGECSVELVGLPGAQISFRQITPESGD